MKTLTLTNLSLVLIIAVLYWLVNLPEQTSPKQAVLSKISVNDINTITIQRQNRDEIQLLKKEGLWFIQQPIQAAANQTRIKLLLNLLSQSSYSQYEINSKYELQQFDLEPASLILKMNQHTFSFGSTENLSQRRYIEHQGIIHLIDDTISPLLNSTATSFIDNRLFSDHLQINQLQLPLLTNNPITELETITINMEDGHWNSDYPTSADKLSTLIDNWQHAYALQVSVVKDKQSSQDTAHKLFVSFAGVDEKMELLLHIHKSTFTLTNPLSQLQYHFPLATIHQLFINKE